MNKTLRVVAIFAAIAAAFALAGCSRQVLTGVSQKIISDGQEPYFNVGGVTYQIQETRALNPFSDDVDYFTGLKTAQSIPGDDFWYGVFLWAKNQSKQTKVSAESFVLTDSEGHSYAATPLPSVNPFAWTSTALAQNAIEPDPDSIAAAGNTNGGLILFKLPESAYQNRPLTLHIYAPGATHAASVSLDL